MLSGRDYVSWGYVYGKNVTFEYRYAEGEARQFPQLAAEMVGLSDMIFVSSTDFTAAAKQATSTIPVVSIGGDPVAAGRFEPSSAGGNITGSFLFLQT